MQQMGRTQGFNDLRSSGILFVFFFVVLFGLCGLAVVIIIIVVPSRLLPEQLGALAARIRGLCGRRGRSLAGVGYNSVSINRNGCKSIILLTAEGAARASAVGIATVAGAIILVFKRTE
jgi:hypothetical protein